MAYPPSPYKDKDGNEIPLEKFDNDTPPPPLEPPKKGENPIYDRLAEKIDKYKPKR